MTATRLALALVFVCATTWAETAPTVTCKDGTTSKGGRGACRGHGGVDRTKAAGAVVPAPAPSPAAENARPAAIPTPRAPAPGATEKVARSGGKSATDDPTGALAKCRDGMYWHGTRHSGSCSHHGGVDSWPKGVFAEDLAEVRAIRAAQRDPAQ